MTLKSRLRTTH